jgi:hypothetical protein
MAPDPRSSEYRTALPVDAEDEVIAQITVSLS